MFGSFAILSLMVISIESATTVGRIKNKLGKCLDADGGISNGRRVQLWECLYNFNQVFTYDQDGRIKIGAEGDFCLDVDEAQNKPQAWDCHINNNNQNMEVVASDEAGYYNIICTDCPGGRAGYCLTQPSLGDNQNGDSTEMAECNDGDEQKFRFG